jgi:hypothetical protein
MEKLQLLVTMATNGGTKRCIFQDGAPWTAGGTVVLGTGKLFSFGVGAICTNSNTFIAYSSVDDETFMAG